MSDKGKKRSVTNIVPLKTDLPIVDVEMAIDATSPQLVYNGGPLLTSVEVFTIFWGQDWNNATLKDLPPRLVEFFKLQTYRSAERVQYE